MEVFVRSSSTSSSRTKRVTDPLDDKVKACICGGGGGGGGDLSYVSSGSEHEAADHDSSCLSALIHGFLEENDQDLDQPGGINKLSNDFSDDEDYFSKIIESTKDSITDLLKPIDSFRSVLHKRVSQATEIYSNYRSSSNKSIFRRKVMFRLREIGYNAGICKTKWESCGGLTSGNYEFIDVVKSGTRYFIDVDFGGEFTIARATDEYEKLLEVIPNVYVGRSDELKQIVKLMSDAAKRSLKSRDLLLSPWRKNRFMQMKWFGPYKRTLNQVPMTMASPFQNQQQKFAVKCQAIGFNVVSKGNGNGNGGLGVSVATRTR